MPELVALTVYAEVWKLIRDELDLIVENDLMGMVPAIAARAPFLRLAPAFRVAIGAPATFMASPFGFYDLGGSINATNIVGFIMALGIVEESLTSSTPANRRPTPPLVAMGDAAIVAIALVATTASLVECLLILPGRLRHAFERAQRRRPRRWQQRLRRFVRFVSPCAPASTPAPDASSATQGPGSLAPHRRSRVPKPLPRCRCRPSTA